jgi:SAM-dependent methyltransferase
VKGLKIEIVNKNRNELLKRSEIVFHIDYEKSGTPSNADVRKKIAETLSYPVVVKGSLETGKVRYATSSEQLIRRCNELSQKSSGGKLPLIQEYIPGVGYGFFALFNKGKPKCVFMHKRILEYDPTMPVSVGDVECLNYPDNYFDIYFSGGVIEHFEEGPLRVLQEAHRVLKPDGILILTVPYINLSRKIEDMNDFTSEMSYVLYAFFICTFKRFILGLLPFKRFE